MKSSRLEQFVKMVTSPIGRGGRIAMGLAMLSLGQFVARGTAGTALTVASLVPISAGVPNLTRCLSKLICPESIYLSLSLTKR